MKKIILTLGGVAAIAAPLAVISCNDKDTKDSNLETQMKKNRGNEKE